jgi:hypothetical protein
MDANDYGNPALHPDAAVRLATAVNSAHWLGRGSCTSLRSYGDAQKSGVSPAPTSSLITELLREFRWVV